jgi:phage shock protein A
MSGFDSNTALSGLKRMEEKALQLEAEAEASGEVYKKEKSLDEEFMHLGRDKEVEDELARIMKQYEK